MHHGLDLLVAAAQVARRVGVLHIAVVGDALGQGGQQLGADVAVAEALDEFAEPVADILLEFHRSNPLVKGGGGRRPFGADVLLRFIIVAKGRWRDRRAVFFVRKVFLVHVVVV